MSSHVDFGVQFPGFNTMRMHAHACASGCCCLLVSVGGSIPPLVIDAHSGPLPLIESHCLKNPESAVDGSGRVPYSC